MARFESELTGYETGARQSGHDGMRFYERFEEGSAGLHSAGNEIVQSQVQ